MDSDLVLIIVVVTALAFDFTNGFHDTANVVATSISTRAMAPRIAVAYAAVLNFVGAFLSLAVAATIASGIVEADLINEQIVFAGLVGAIALEPDHLVLRAALQLLARADRRRGGLGVRGRGPRRGDRRRPDRQGGRAGARGAGARLRGRGHRDPRDLPDRRGPAAGVGHPRLQGGADPLRRPARARPRHQRRPEDDGHHRARAGGQRPARGGRRPAHLGGRLGRHRDRARHLHGRLADHQDDGQPHHQDGHRAGLRGAGQRRGGDPGRLARGLPAVHHPHDLRRGDGRRRRQAPVGRALGRGRATSSWPGCSPSRRPR